MIRKIHGFVVVLVVLLGLHSALAADMPAVFSDDGRYFASSMSDTLAVWNVSNGKIVAVIQAPSAIEEAYFNAGVSSPQVTMQLQDGRVASVDLFGHGDLRWNEPLYERSFLNFGSALAYGWRVVRVHNGDLLCLKNLVTGAKYPITPPVPMKRLEIGFSFSADGRNIVAYAPVPKAGGYCIWQSTVGPNGFTQYKGLTKAWPMYTPGQVLMSSDGAGIVAIVLRPTPNLLVWSKTRPVPMPLGQLRQSGYLQDIELPDRIALSGDGAVLALAYRDDTVDAISTSTGHRLASIDARPVLRAAGIWAPIDLEQSGPQGQRYYSDIWSVAISPDKRLIAIRLEWKVMLWNLASGKAVLLEQAPFTFAPTSGGPGVGKGQGRRPREPFDYQAANARPRRSRTEWAKLSAVLSNVIKMRGSTTCSIWP